MFFFCDLIGDAHCTMVKKPKAWHERMTAVTAIFSDKLLEGRCSGLLR